MCMMIFLSPIATDLTFYHYTNAQEARLICNQGKIVHVNGILLTTLDPELYYPDEIIDTIYYDEDTTGRDHHADYCVEISGSDLDCTRLRQLHKQGVYLYSDNINVNEDDVLVKAACIRDRYKNLDTSGKCFIYSWS